MRDNPPLPEPPPLDRSSALFLDIDGTLLEIASRPDLVHVAPGLPPLLKTLATQRGGALALVSGRPLDEIDWLFCPWHGPAAGLHGVERRRADGTLDYHSNAAAKLALERVRPRLAALTHLDGGLFLEDKRTGVALHYRNVPKRETEILAAAQALHDDEKTVLRLIFGKMVLEFAPLEANKGAAIAAFLTEPPFCGRRPTFVGDDTTDEDGFAEVKRRGGTAIQVGGSLPTSADFHLNSVAEVLRWLGGNM
jgi:trehalose 6-phosphate phosphatase